MPAMATTAAPVVLDILDPDFRVDSPVVHEAAARHRYARTELGPAILTDEDSPSLLHDRRVRQGGAQHLADQGWNPPRVVRERSSQRPGVPAARTGAPCPPATGSLTYTLVVRDSRRHL
jgi:hypothetical protein